MPVLRQQAALSDPAGHLLHGNLAGDFFTAAVPCGGCNCNCSRLYSFDDTLLGHGRNILIAGGPLEGFVISGGRCDCHFEGGGLALLHSEFGLVDRQFRDGLSDRDLADGLDLAAVGYRP